MKKKVISLLTMTAFLFTVFSTPVTVQAKKSNEERVTFGIDLTDSEEAQLLDEFKVSADSVSIDRITNDDIIKQLGLDPNDPANHQGGCYSSSYVKVTNDGGILVSSKNLTEVTDLMLSNALVTSGVVNAEVKASSPFEVTGTSALAGILKGVESVRGEELSITNKKVAQEEIETTAQLGQDLVSEGTEEEAAKNVAANIIYDVKVEVIKEAPETVTEIKDIVVNVTNDYDVNISQDQITNITNLMTDVNKLDIDYDKFEDTLDGLGDKLTGALEQAGEDLKNSGFFSGLWDGICDFFDGIFDWFGGLFDSNDAETSDDATTGTDIDENSDSTDTSDSSQDATTEDPQVEEPQVDDTTDTGAPSTDDTLDSSDDSTNDATTPDSNTTTDTNDTENQGVTE